MEHEGDADTIYSWCALHGYPRLVKGTGKGGNRETSRNHPDYSIAKIGKNTEKSPGDLRRLTVSNDSDKRTLVNADVKNAQGTK